MNDNMSHDDADYGDSGEDGESGFTPFLGRHVGLPVGQGLSEEHMKRCREWTVYMLAEHPDPEPFVNPGHWRAGETETAGNDRPAPGTLTAARLPAPGIDDHESGFGIRNGWGGRSHRP